MARRPAHRRSFEALESVAERSTDAIVITDARGVIEFVNPAFEALTGFIRSEAVGLTPVIVRSGQHGEDFYCNLWATICAGAVFRGIFSNRRKNGELFREDEVIIPFADGSGQITHFVSAGRDASTRVRNIDRLMHQATHDSLTDLPDRSLFLDRLGQTLKYALRRREGFTLAIADIDRFKEVNDTLGHAAGDAVLQAVGARLQQFVREVDTVARLGGDEFGLILVDVGEASSAAKVFEKMLMAFRAPARAEERAVQVSLSIGACLFPADAGNESALLRRADAAMYAAKRLGGNGYSFSGATALPRHETQLTLWDKLPADVIDERGFFWSPGMKTAKASKEMLFPNAAFLAAVPSWSTLDAWSRRSRERTPATPLSAEGHYRMIELAAQHQAARRRVTPESDLRDWLDAEEEGKLH